MAFIDIIWVSFFWYKKGNPNFGLASQQLEVLADRSCQFVDDAVSLLGV
jgi:hypothetical protein